jgi:hypothetical protein
VRKTFSSATAALLCAGAAAVLLFSQPAVNDDPFLEKPYLQLGDAPKLSKNESLVLMWQTTTAPASWAVEVRTRKDSKWRKMEQPRVQSVSAPAGPPAVAGRDGAKKDAPGSPAIARHLVYRATMTELPAGEEFSYRVLREGKPVFSAEGRARKAADQPYRFALFGDCGAGTPSEKAIAYQTSLAKPDFVFIPGDIVYTAGRISEYRAKFFPVYNADTADAEHGAPLLRSVPFIAAPGNHDSALLNFPRFPDALAYFLYWDQPLNGPDTPAGTPNTSHELKGSEEARNVFEAGAKPRYPRMANFSFDYGNSHWVVLDSNAYMDWNNPTLREWLEKDLAKSKSADFRFVAFHHPGFNSSKAHFTDQWMRSLAPIFEAQHVDIVFAGHVHNYQRSFPLTFLPKPQPDGSLKGPKGEVAGDWKLDQEFVDGAKKKPHGVIYIVSGAGGAGLYNPEQESNQSTWQAFTNKFVSNTHSLSIVDIHGKELRLRQVSETGTEVDAFRITK